MGRGRERGRGGKEGGREGGREVEGKDALYIHFLCERRKKNIGKENNKLNAKS